MEINLENELQEQMETVIEGFRNSGISRGCVIGVLETIKYNLLIESTIEDDDE